MSTPTQHPYDTRLNVLHKHLEPLSMVKEVLTPEEVEHRLRGFAAQMKGQDE